MSGVWRQICRAAAVFLLIAGFDTVAGVAASPGVSIQASPKDREELQQLRSTAMKNAALASRQAEVYVRELESRPKTLERQVAIAEAMRIQADASIRLGQVESAENLLNAAQEKISNFHDATKVRADIKISQGSISMSKGRASQALELFHSAYDIYRLSEDRRGQSVALQNIAALYTVANDNEQAEKYYKQAGDIYDSDPILSTYLHNNRGNVLLQLERYDEAQTQYLRALKGARSLNSNAMVASIYDNLARTQIEAGNLPKAVSYLNRAFGALPDATDAMRATRARLLLSQGRTAAARQIVDRIFDGREIGSVDSYYEQFVAYQVYAAAGDTAKALQHLEVAKRLNDEATKVASSTNAALAAARFDFQNQELRIAKLKAEELRRNIAFERSVARFQRTIFASIGGATLVLIVVLSFSLFTIGRSRNREREAKLKLADTNIALEKALAAKTEFLATTSHEIRTPLNGILGMTQVMLIDRQLPDDLRDRVNVIHGAGVTMRALVDDILDVAKMENGKLTIECCPMDLHAALREVAAVWRDHARNRGLDLTLDIGNVPGWIEGDSGRLRQILFNLLANALKFTEKGGVGVVAQAIEAEERELLQISVSDTGIGIPPEKFEDIFESFKQVDGGTTRRFGGTGLGLSICRNLAIALGGTIAVESEESVGSRFTITLPLLRVDPPQTSHRGNQNAGLIVLERNPIARGMLKKVLAADGGGLRFVDTPEALLQEIRASAPSLILLDHGSLGAPDAQLVEKITKISAAARAAGARLTLLCKPEDSAFLSRIIEAGVDEIIEKPISGPALVQRLFGKASDERKNQPLVSHAT